METLIEGYNFELNNFENCATCDAQCNFNTPGCGSYNTCPQD